MFYVIICWIECIEIPDPNCDFATVWDPVCGCNNVTYINSGEAECNNIFEWIQGPCETNTSLIINYISNKTIIQVIDLMGRRINNLNSGQVVLFIFNDGSVEKKNIE